MAEGDAVQFSQHGHPSLKQLQPKGQHDMSLQSQLTNCHRSKWQDP